ncbi:Fe(3+) ABC transporter substrate-binding protein [Coralliovum pocilloporae]|uniref:Fe(3+) ABC transporter substrate-binding protein n=1 Tax=Coralliovum pocilloporae TaxID=3066369 RepID=UPI003306C19B
MTVSARLLAGAALLSVCATTTSAFSEEVNVYSYRQPFLLEPLTSAFTEKTGIKVNVVFAKKGLGERIKAEGANSPADVIMTVDIGRLDGARALGVTQSVTSDVISANVPAAYRDSEGHWFGLTTRARITYVSKDRVTDTALTYEELADPKWNGKICIRSGQHPYNISLIASMIAHKGEAAAKEWLEGFKSNLARKPSGNDRAQVKGIYSGECDVAIGNTYYMGKMQTNDKDPEQKDWADSVRIVFPNSEDRGSHVNISGMAMAKHAPNRDAAVKFMEYLSSDEAQKIYAEANFEYPVKAGVGASERVKSWGELKADELTLNEIAKLRKRASELVDEVAFDDGPAS